MQRTTTEHAVRMAAWTEDVELSMIQRLLSTATRPGILSFALGLPATDLFPLADYIAAATHTLTKERATLQYGPPCLALKRHIVHLMALRGVSCTEEQIFLTTGAQQALSLLTRLFTDRHGSVLLEETIYSGITQAIEPLRPRVLTVPTDEATGMDMQAVTTLLEKRRQPAFIYAISDGHNPMGVSMTLEKRQQLVQQAKRHKVPIIEDDAYGFLWYEQEALPPLRSLDAEWVFYVGSFSKILAPALRVGWIVLPENVPEKLTAALAALKESSDINAATFAQHTIATYLDMGHLPDHLSVLRRGYRLRRDAMVQALQEYFPADSSWHVPSSGMFIWIRLPRQVHIHEMLKLAIEREEVAFVPGSAFHIAARGRADHCIRLNFSTCQPEQIEQGIARLARVAQATCKK